MCGGSYQCKFATMRRGYRNVSTKRGKLVSNDKEQFNGKDHLDFITTADETGVPRSTGLTDTSATKEFEEDMDDHHLLQQTARSMLNPDIKTRKHHVTRFLEDMKKLQNSTAALTDTSRLEKKVMRRCSQFLNDVLRKESTSNELDIDSGNQWELKGSKHSQDDDDDPEYWIQNEETESIKDASHTLSRGREKQDVSLVNARISRGYLTNSDDNIQETHQRSQFRSDTLDDGSLGWDANDMFYRNKERFGITSSYSPDMEGYTTLLTRKNTPEYIQKEKEAERIANEIQSSSLFCHYEEAENKDEESIMYTEDQKSIKEQDHSFNLYGVDTCVQDVTGFKGNVKNYILPNSKSFIGNKNCQSNSNSGNYYAQEILSLDSSFEANKSERVYEPPKELKKIIDDKSVTIKANSPCFIDDTKGCSTFRLGSLTESSIKKSIDILSTEAKVNEHEIKKLCLRSKIEPVLAKTNKLIANRKKMKKESTVANIKQGLPTQVHDLSQESGNITLVRRHNIEEYSTSKCKQVQDDNVMNRICDPAKFNSSLMSLTASALSLDSMLHTAPPNIKPAKMTALYVPEKVEVTHVVNPSLFYICLETNVYKRDKFQRIIQRLACGADQAINPQIGELYLGQYIDGRWYRAVVKAKGIKKDEFHIKYVDYGNGETINKVKLRECTDSYGLEMIPSFSLSCGLWDVIPAHGVTWDSEAITTFTDLVEGVHLQLFVTNITEHNCERKPMYDIELRRPVTTIGIANTVPTSIREVLVFLELALFINESKEDAFDQMVKHWKKPYFQQEVPFGEENCPVELGYSESPGLVYLHLKRFSEDRQKLKQQIQYHYNSARVRASKDWNMLVPKVGMSCIAKYSEDGKWYRARITDIPGKKMVDVFYVDFGNIERLWYKQIKRIHEDFLRLPAQAIRCHIYDVFPISEEKWEKNLHKEILDSFLLLVEGKNLYANFHNVVNIESRERPMLFQDESSYSVSLTAVSEESNSMIDVGLFLIDSGFAGTEKMEDNMYSSTLKSERNSNELYLPRKKTLRQAIEFYDPCIKINSFPVSDTPKNTRKKVIYVGMTDNFIHLQYKIHLKKCQDLQARLENEMQLAPADATFTPKEGKVCVLTGDHKPYYARVRILRIYKDNVLVHLIDCGGIEEVSLLSLLPMPEKFREEKSLAVIVSLKDLEAPGGSAKWPLSTLDFMKSFLNNYSDSLYIVRKEASYPDPIYDMPIIPVEMGWEIEELGGPISPSVVKPISLNQLLVQEGYALRARFANLREEHYRAMGNKSCSQSTATLVNGFDTSLECSPIYSDSILDLSERQDPIGDTNPLLYMVNQNDDCIKQWLPAVLPQSHVFTAIPKWVDMDAKIYVNLLADIENLDTINDNQTLQYKHSKPTNGDLCYETDDMVIAKYHNDSGWYRGTVSSIENGMTMVRFVDYGNTETISVGDIRKDITYKNQPILSHRCILDGIVPIHPDGRWSLDALDLLHQKIVEKECRIQVVRPARIGEDLHIKLEVINSKDHKDIGDWLVDAMKICKRVFKAETDVDSFKVKELDCYEKIEKKYTSFDEESTDVVIEESLRNISLYEESDDGPYSHHEVVAEYFKPIEVHPSIPLPEMELPINIKFPAKIISIINENEMFIMPKLDKWDLFPCLKNIKKSKDRYDQDLPNINPLMNRLVSNPVIGKIYMGVHCYGSKLQYRIQVLEDKRKDVKVLFVDQGMEKTIAKKSLRICEPKAYQHPLQCAKVSLYVKDKKVHYYWSDKAINREDCRCQLDGVYAKVKRINDDRIPEVQLSTSTLSDQELYEEFVQLGYLLKTKNNDK